MIAQAGRVSDSEALVTQRLPGGLIGFPVRAFGLTRNRLAGNSSLRKHPDSF